MLNPMNHVYWCIKSDNLSTTFATLNTSIQVVDAMKYFYEITFRKEHHGANMTKMTLNKTKNRHYEVRGLFTSLKSNLAMLVEIQIQKFANKLQQVLTHPNFMGCYIYMLRQTGADRIADILKMKTAPFWKNLQEAETSFVLGRHLDAVFLDEDIAKIIGDKKVKWNRSLLRNTVVLGRIALLLPTTRRARLLLLLKSLWSKKIPVLWIFLIVLVLSWMLKTSFRNFSLLRKRRMRLNPTSGTLAMLVVSLSSLFIFPCRVHHCCVPHVGC